MVSADGCVMKLRLGSLRRVIHEALLHAGPVSASDVHSLDDLRVFAKPLIGERLFTHAVRTDDEIDLIVAHGIALGRNATVSSTRTTDAASKDGIDAHGVRERGGGYVVFEADPATARMIDDVVEAGLKYPEWAFDTPIRPHAIVKVVRVVVDDTGHRIREDHLAAYALRNQGRTDIAQDLPSAYAAWFSLVA